MSETSPRDDDAVAAPHGTSDVDASPPVTDAGDDTSAPPHGASAGDDSTGAGSAGGDDSPPSGATDDGGTAAPRPAEAPAARRLYVTLGLALLALAAHVVPEVSAAVWGALDTLQARLVGEGALPAPLGLLAVAWDHWSDELLVAFAAAVALALLGVRMAWRGVRAADRKALGLLYQPAVYKVVVEGWLLRGVCRSIAYTVDAMLLAIPVALIVPLGGFVAWIANAAVRKLLDVPTPPFFLEATQAALGPEAGVVAMLRDVVVGIVGFWLLMRGWKGWRGALVAVYHEDLEPAIIDSRRRP